MSFASVLRGLAVAAAALFVALGSHVAMAQPAGDAPSQPGAPGAAGGPLKVWIDLAGTSFDQARLQASLRHELGQQVVFTDDEAASSVQIRLHGAARADVHYITPNGEELSRSVDLPPDGQRAVDVVSWLTVNLVRDEASELLDELRARRKEEADARAAANKAAADKAAADKAAADKAAREAEQAKKNQKPPAEPTAPKDALLRDPLHSFDAAVATPLSFLPDSSKRELKLQLALGYGESGALRGVGLSMGVLRVRQDLLGIGAGLGAVLIGKNARGVVAALGYCQVEGNLDGFQVAIGAARQRGPAAHGAVLAVGGAFAQNIGGLIMAAGLTGASSVDGLQLSAGVNVARELNGVALGLVNVHRRVRGLQLGLVNVADEVDGAAIGLLSFAKNGRVQPLSWVANDGSVHIAIKSIAGYVFTQLGGGIELSGASFGYDGGIGAHLRLGQSWFFEPGVHYSSLQSTVDASGAIREHQLHYLGQVGLRVGGKLDFLVAAGARHAVAGGSVAPELRAGIAFF